MAKKIEKPKEFSLHYHIRNGGDGSASPEFHQTQEEAEKADEEMDEGWGECCAGSVRLKVENNKLYYLTHTFVDRKYESVWKEVQRAK